MSTSSLRTGECSAAAFDHDQLVKILSFGIDVEGNEVKTLRVGIASFEDMKARSMAMVRVTSPQSFAKALSNRTLLDQIDRAQIRCREHQRVAPV